MMEMFPLEPHWVWLILAAILGIAEIILPGFFLIWIGVAALLTGVATLLLGLPEAAQFATFAVLAIVAVFAGRRWFALNPIESSDPLLNDRAARLIGEIVTATEAFDSGVGRVKVGDGVWSARSTYGEDFTLGTRLRVSGVDRGALLVEPLG
jgi:membrane protein implicated in regulation of membrane protease activity